MKKLFLAITLCISSILYAQNKTSKDDIRLADGYDMPNDTRTVTVIIPKSVPGATGLADYAKAFEKPDYIPKYSDVVMRSLRFRPSRPDDEKLQRNTFTAMDLFHVTRLEWTYLKDESEIPKVKEVLKSGRVFGSTVDCHPLAKDTGLCILTIEGKPIVAKHHRQFDPLPGIGCMNRPAYFEQQLAGYKKYFDLGIPVIQRDDPQQNSVASSLGGCFCPHCMVKFNQWLKANISPSELAANGVSDLSAFNYKDYLISINAPSGDDFAGWNGGKLKEWLIQSNALVEVEFYAKMRKALNEYAGKYYPISSNNTSFQRWTPAHKSFDWGYSEMIMSTAKPERIYERSYAARNLGKIQVYSAPKVLGNEVIPEEVRYITIRRATAACYATGGIMSVPWDVYEQTPSGSDRYFGTPQQYADLFGFVRGIAPYLEKYEEVGAAGRNIAEQKFDGKSLFGRLPDGVFAFARAIPNDKHAPVVIHVVNWNNAAAGFTLELDKKLLFGGNPVKCSLLTPVAYSENNHKKAEQKAQKLRTEGTFFSAKESPAYNDLVTKKSLPVTEKDGKILLDIRELALWGVLVVEGL
ncbi:MAG: hypothetical protein O2887_10565 [Bacteroidetes bacterium]|nr:hypothetical protein [Bacteroidota bacterium]